MEFFKVIKKRRSVRNFVKAKIPRSELRKIVDAGRFAPCGGNSQRWHFIAITDKKIIDKVLVYLKISKILYEMLVYLKSNKISANLKIENSRNTSPQFNIFINTSAIIAIAFDVKWHFYKEDGSAAIENMLLAATALGYGSCWVGGAIMPYLEDVEKLLNIPANIKLFSMIVLGKPEKWPKTPPKKKLEEILHWDKF